MANPQAHLRVTVNNAAEQFEGKLLGVDTHQFVWLALALAAGAGLFVVLSRVATITAAAGCGFLIPLCTLVLLRIAQSKGPPGTILAAAESMITGGHASPRPGLRLTSAPLFAGLPDAHLVDGMLVGEGPDGPWVAKGWEVQEPDRQTASAEELNLHQDAWSALLRQLSVGERLQVLCVSGSGDAQRLLDYLAISEQADLPEIRKVRNATFLEHWRRMEQGKLRKRQMVIFLIRPRVKPTRTKEERHADENSASADLGQPFRQWAQAAERILEPANGRLVELCEADVLGLWSDRIGGSATLSPDPHLARHFDPTLTLLENLWNSELDALGRTGLFTLGGYLHRSFSLQRLPSETYPSLIHALAYIPHGGITYSAHIRRLSKEPLLARAQASVERIERQMAGKSDERLAVSLEQLQQRIRRISYGEAAPIEFQLNVLLRARSMEELEVLTGAVRAAVQAMNGAQLFEASLPVTARALFGTCFPGCPPGRRAGFLHLSEDRPVADCLPVASTFPGHPAPVAALFHGADGNLVNIVPMLGEGDSANPQNLLILGAPGVGKSVVLNFFLAQTDPLFGFTAIIDSGLSQVGYPHAHHLKPTIIRLDGTVTINLFDTQGMPMTPFAIATQTATVQRMLGVPRDEDRARRQAAAIEREIQKLCEEKARDVLQHLSERDRENLIRHCLALLKIARQEGTSFLDAFVSFRELKCASPQAADRLLAEASAEEVRGAEIQYARDVRALTFASLRPEEHLRLSALREHMELSDEEEIRWMAVLLVQWTEGGAYGALFDGAHTADHASKVVYYELGQLPQAAKDVADVMGFQLINALHYQCLALPRHLWKRIIVEEISRFLELQGADAILRNLSESFRKYRVQLVMCGQTASRIADSPVRAAIFGNLRSLLIFNTGDRLDIERLANDLGLSELARETILRFPRPDQIVGQKYSEFLYYHTDAVRPICGVARHYATPENTLPSSPSSV